MPGDESYSAGGGTGWEEVGGGGRRWDYGQPVGAMPLLAASVSQHCEGCVVSAGGTRVLSRETTCQRLWRSAVGWVRMPAAPHCTMCASRSPRCPCPRRLARCCTGAGPTPNGSGRLEHTPVGSCQVFDSV